jgi:NAD(P)-dependent dehydrogenase (short-subunit alcohol dehydrogenase family)
MGKFAAGFSNTVALVTGGASGIGLATARRLSAEGATVVIADRDEARGKGVAEASGLEFVAMDVSDPEAWEQIVAEITRRHGALHLVHLNAGITTYRIDQSPEGGFDLASMPLENYRRIMGANIDGVILGARATLPALTASGGGALIVTASAAGALAFPPDPIYTATKHAVVGFVRSMAPSLEASNIGCHAIMPGIVDTGLLSEGFADQAKSMGMPIIPPEDIADAVINAARAEKTGGLWICLATRPPYRYQFEPLDGPVVPVSRD